MQDIYSALNDLYENEMPNILRVGNLCNSNEKGMEGPFLTCPPKAYFTAIPRILIVGQETCGWESTTDVKKQMDACLSFMLDRSKSYPSPFWNIIAKIESTYGFSDRSVAWSNLNRYDRNGKPPRSSDLQYLSELDRLLSSEISILKPRLTIFFTGPRFASRIDNIVPGNWKAAEGFTDRQITEMQYNDCMFIKTYHPNYLRRSKLESKFLDYIGKLKTVLFL